MAQDIFTTLSRYASYQEENFLTEAFAYLFIHILEREPDVGAQVLKNLLSCPIDKIQANINAIQITTQQSFEEGRPDLVIQLGDDGLFFIEVKHDAKIGEKQLECYISALNKDISYTYKQLVLLTRSRHSIQETGLDPEKFHHVCWYELSGWLSEIGVEDEVIQFLVEEFQGFLRSKEMSMEKVNWEYIKGVPALRNLANALGVAIAEAIPEEKTKRTAGWNWIGYYIGEGTNIWVGVRYKNHLKLVMENNTGDDPAWRKELNLNEKHFFSLDAGQQMECLIDFIDEQYKKVEEYVLKS